MMDPFLLAVKPESCRHKAMNETLSEATNSKVKQGSKVTWNLMAIHFPSLPKSPKYLVSRCLDPLKAFEKEVFVGPNTYSQGIWKTRVFDIYKFKWLFQLGDDSNSLHG